MKLHCPSNILESFSLSRCQERVNGQEKACLYLTISAVMTSEEELKASLKTRCVRLLPIFTTCVP
jgi:hypothetical protein